LPEAKGKQHKRRLKTTDLAEAKRKLRDYRAEVEVTTPGAGKVTVQQVFIAAIEGQVRCVTDIEIVGLAIAFRVPENELLPNRKSTLKALSS